MNCGIKTKILLPPGKLKKLRLQLEQNGFKFWFPATTIVWKKKSVIFIYFGKPENIYLF